MKKIIITVALFACFFGYSQRIFTGKLIDFNKCNIVVASNSLGTPQFGSIPWPTQLQTIINNPNCTLTNLSVSGKSISEILNDFPFQIPQLFQPGKTNVLIVHEMINERFFQRSPTLAISIQKFKKYCLDAFNTPEHVARYANDAEGLSKVKGLKNNAEYQITDKTKCFIIAKRDIAKNEEIFVSYTKEYWDAIRYNIKLKKEGKR